MCELCLRAFCHPRCPNHVPPKTSHYCSVCNEGIYDGEKYIENYNGDLAHWDCICGMYDLADFLEIEIKEMENSDERDY